VAQGAIRTKVEFRVVGASGVITLTEPAAAIVNAALWSGSTTQTGWTTGTITTATSSVLNSLAFTGTAEKPSRTVTANSSLGAGSAVLIEYIPAGAVAADV